MVYLAFYLDNERYALEVRQVIEVIPRVRLRPIPGAEGCTAGLLSYRAQMVPIIDLSTLLWNKPAPVLLSSRIILVHYPVPHRAPLALGLIAGRVTDTVRLDSSRFMAPGLRPERAQYLGPIVSDNQGLIQIVDLDKILSPALHESLTQSAQRAYDGN